MINRKTMEPFDISCYNKLYEKFQYHFEPELINEICQNSQLHIFKPEDIIIDIGSPLTHMPIVVNGTIKILTEDKDGQELLLYYLELGDTCSVTLNCGASKSKSTIRAIAESNTELLFIPFEKMDDWMVKYRKWRDFVLNSYNDRLNEMLEAIDNLAFNNMNDRLLKYLKDKMLISSSPELSISHSAIANDLNSSRVVISRMMKKLEKEGYLKQLRNKIEIIDINKLLK